MLNKVMIIGRLGRDPEIKYSQSGLAIVTLAIATSEKFQNKTTQAWEEKTEWHRVVAFGKQAENCEKYLTKGSTVYIEGKLQTDSYEKDGITQYATKIIAYQVSFLDSKKGNKEEPKRQQASQYNPNINKPQQPTNNVTPYDDIPF